MERTMTLEGHRIEVSNIDKVLFPGSGLTKGDLVDYYARVAPTALPHYRGRPLTLHRFPDGIEEDGFFQKNAGDHFPAWIRRERLPKENGTVDFVVAEGAATLAYLANQGMITPHVGLSRVDRIECPDRLIFDLDPPDEGDFGEVRWAAGIMRELLESVELVPFVQTTGSRGLHVVVPLDPSRSFDEVLALTQRLAERLAQDHPERLTTEQRKSKRAGRLYLDVQRNAYNQSAVAPYGVRARPGAPVATPLDWSEVEDGSLRPDGYTIGNLFRRLGQKDDPWAAMDRRSRSLDAALERFPEPGS